MTRFSFWFTLALVSAGLACGGGDDSNIKVGGNGGNDENNVETDAGNNQNNRNNRNNQNNTDPGDAGNDDGPSDASPAEDTTPPEDTSEPDMSEPDDTGSDASSDEEMGVDMADPNCPALGIAYGEPCDCDAACLSGLCLDDTATSPGTCSRTCMSRQDCPVGDNACVMDDGLQQLVCRPDETGESCDANGDAAPSMCDLGTCIQGGSSYVPAHFCTIPCSAATDCKMGHSCSPARCKTTSTGDLACIPTLVAHRAGTDKSTILAAFPLDANVCMPVGQDLGADGWCTATPSNQFACPSGICDDDADRCTGQCSETNDCPAGGCVDLDVSDPDLPIRICDFPA